MNTQTTISTQTTALIWLFMFGVVACADETSTPSTNFEQGEEAPGGETTNRFLLGGNAYIKQSANLDDDNEAAFFTGNSFFNQAWIQSPASTTTRDGLGPLFNARSCSGCHFKDGRGRPSTDPSKPHNGFLVRLSIPGQGEHGGPVPEPTYGGQLQDHAIQNVLPEGKVWIQYTTIKGQYDDGTQYTLSQPIYHFKQLRDGPLEQDAMFSPRVAPAMIGLGLLEAIDAQRLKELADPNDANGDGISGKINMVWDIEGNTMRPGRFGWKAEQPSVRQQVAGAFWGDIGITSTLFPNLPCSPVQIDCQQSKHGSSDDEPEILPHLLDRVVIYSQTLAPPIRVNANTQKVLQGKALFHETGCATCHTPNHKTGDHTIPALANQTIWPYTDLLLHDMGEGLADNRPVYTATGREWRTPPLWGLSHLKAVNGHMQLMHDGRANGVEEAILWHGGEASRAIQNFKALPVSKREKLITFVESL